ncbi:uncharacterized protein HD556DRAFT_1326198 [Suillus plorans]|uniref:Uncharacterized protein n=1 Tax=Suillus plorans TaxID=116603 RepID=A0A9P7DW78_9AGAM|nr:uncharacterized protein HD556DRAFT_1326198 [Suillus plorans]KAG1804772.1 hypothetical protein HD556DRAFT_1326198 [Suillus plorans]
MVECIVESRWGLAMFFYLACSHLPFAFVSMNMLAVLQPDAPYPLCRSYEIANIWVLSTLFVECIFLLRAYAVWGRKTWIAIFSIISVIAYLVPIFIYFREFWSVSGECWIPGAFGYQDANSKSMYVVFGLLAVGELQVLIMLLYGAIKGHDSWKIDNRLVRGLLQQNLLYFSCSLVLTLSVILATFFFPFPFAHVVAEYQAVLQPLLVTRMHRNFQRSDRASCGIQTDMSFTTWTEGVSDII